MNICLSKNYLGGVHILERFFEFNACNAFGLTEYAPGYKSLFKEGVDIVTFKNKEELLNKIKYYLKNESTREKIANCAYLKTKKYYDNTYLLQKAIKFMEKDKKNKYGARLDEIKSKFIYVDKKDLLNKELLLKKTMGFDYVCFKDNKTESLKYKEYFQMNALRMFKKPICCCDAVLCSKMIGEYAIVALSYAIDMEDKSYYADNLEINQLMVKRGYLIKNLEKFISISNGKNKFFVSKSNTSYIFYPFIRMYRNKKIPLIKSEHVSFCTFEEKLIVLRNRKKLWASTYIPKLLIYSIVFNRQLLNRIFSQTMKRSKNKGLIGVTNAINRVFSARVK